jgi:outer membrane lipoprotein-sorting protein
MIYSLIISILTIMSWNSNSGDKDPIAILEDVKNRYFEIRDFTAKATIIVDVDFVNIPDKEIEIFYKFPSKVKIKTKGFAMIPKKGMNFSIYELFKYEYTAIHVQTLVENRVELEEIKFIPLDKKSDLAIATLWVDHSNRRISRVEGIPKKGGNFMMELEYGNENDVLPIQTKIMFEMEQMRVPFRFFGNLEVDKEKLKEAREGVVTIKYRDYQINLGLKDEIFEEEDSTGVE